MYPSVGGSLLGSNSTTSKSIFSRWGEISLLLVWTGGTLFFDAVVVADLLTQVSGMKLTLMLFILPFNVIAIGLWGALISESLARTTPAPATVAGYRVIEDGQKTRFRLPLSTSFAPAFLAAIVVPVIASFCLFPLQNPPLYCPVSALALTVVSAAIAFGVQARKIETGVLDIIIDRHGGTFTAPESGRGERCTIPFAALVGFRVKMEERKNDGDVSIYHLAIVQWCDEDGHLREVVFAEFSEEQPAKDLTLAMRHDVFGLRLPPVVG